MNDSELEEILNEIKNKKSSSKELDSSEFEDIINSLNSKTPDYLQFEQDAPKEDEQKQMPKKKESMTDNTTAFSLNEKPLDETADDENEFALATEIADTDEKDSYIKTIEQDDELEAQEPSPQELAPQEDIVEQENVAEADDNVCLSDIVDSMEDDKPKKKGKGAIIAIIIVLIVAVACAGVYYHFFYQAPEEPTKPSTTVAETTTEKVALGPLNPLTGEVGFDKNALTQRPVAVVVENEYSTSSVRPQWGLADADIVLEGESEFSTRLLLFWADYNKVPEQVGPVRSARPPFIRFSQLFNSVFIHAGLSHSKDNYVGADEVFEKENIDHINLLSFSESTPYFHRDRSRTSTIEHTGCLMGANTADMLQNSKIDLKLNESKFTKLQFNEEAKPLSTDTANSVSFKWSKAACPKLGTFSYDDQKHKYTTTDFDSKYGTSGVEWENLILLLDETEYITKHNYKHAGNSETYCNYKLSGGKGIICSEGTCVEITWGVKNGKLWMKDAQDNDVVLNPGKSYIGYGSSNHGGYYEVTGANTTSTTESQANN